MKAMSNCLSLNIQEWMADLSLRLCSHHERGVWLDILCLMHKSATVGVLHWPLAQIAHAAGSDVDTLISLVNKGVLKGKCADGSEQVHKRVDLPLKFSATHARRRGDEVVLVDRAPGEVWYCEWMVIAEHKRRTSSAAAMGAQGKVRSRQQGAMEAQTPSFELDGSGKGGRLEKTRASQTPDCPYEEIVALFRARFPNAPKPRALSSTSRLGKAIYGMWRSQSKGKNEEFSGYGTTQEGLRKWERIFDLARQSKFLRGEAPPRPGGEPFRISIDWFMTKTQVERVLNGFYDRPEQQTSIATNVQASAARVAEMVASRYGRPVAAPLEPTPAQGSIF